MSATIPLEADFSCGLDHTPDALIPDEVLLCHHFDAIHWSFKPC